MSMKGESVMEKYSVLMSLYIKEKPEYLDLAIKSMVEQTLKPDEIVIVKDGPITDELQAVLDKYNTAYPELFNIVGYEKNRGLGLALNFGLEHCRNELVARMDTDDISRLNRCEQQIKIFEDNPKIDIVGGDIAEFINSPSETVAYRRVPKTNDDILEYMKTRCALNHVSVMFKKSSIISAGGYKDCFWNEDYYLWIRMWLKGCTFANTGNVLVDVRTGEDMYARRGGLKYFNSEKELQNLMLKNKLINFNTYSINILKRVIVQLLLPNSIRGWVFRKFARR